MALSPGLSRKRGLFGSTPTVPVGGSFGSPVPNMIDETRPPLDDGTTTSAQPLAPQKRGIFGQGGVGRALVGNIGDALLQFANMAPIYGPMVQQQRALQQQEANRLRDFAQQKELIDYRAANREPTSFEQILDAAGIQGDERIGLLRRKAENDAAGVPIAVDVTNPDGSVSRQYVRPGQFGGSQSGPAVGAVEDGFRFKGGNPADKNNWEPVGGAAPPVSQAPRSGNVIDAAGYRAIVQSLGSAAEADAFLRRNGLTKGNF